MVELTRRMTVAEVAEFFELFEEKYLTPFDCNPNSKLPHEQQRVYRIKDFFKATYHRKICKYYIEESEICKTKFIEIFYDNLIHVIQVENEESKLKMMADYEHYDSVNKSDRSVNTNTTSTDSSNNVNKNTSKMNNKEGSLQGSVDVIQLGSVLRSDLVNIDTSKLPDVVDKNIRQYTQGINVSNDLTEVSIEDTGSSTSNINTTGTQNLTARHGIEALNQFRAHSLQVRRIREEFVQCFNVLFE